MAPGTVQSNIFSWNRRLARYVKAQQYEKTMKLFDQMQQEGIRPDKFTFVPVLNACGSLQTLEEGRRIHLQIMQSGCESDMYVGSSLIDMYAKCGSIEEALLVFNKMPTRDVVCWTAMILGYVKCGLGQEALGISKEMLEAGVEPDPVTFVGILNACSNAGALEEGRHCHEQIIQRGLESHVFVGSSLVDMYAKCGSIGDAWKVFNKMPIRDVVGWTSMILGCVKSGQGQKALELSQQMRREGIEPTPVTFVGILNACASVGEVEEGRIVHKQVIESGYESDVFVGSSLVDMYAKCGSTDEARAVFDKMPTRNVVTWNMMILAYVKSGHAEKALELSHKMQVQQIEPDRITFFGVLNACGALAALEKGKSVHEQITQRGYDSDLFVGTCLLDMYAKCGSIEDALRVFNEMPTGNVVTWTAMIQAYVRCGQGQKALELSQQMQQEGVEPNPITFVGLLNACASVGALEEGRRFHQQIIQSNCESDVFVGTCLVDMYAKCGSIEEALRVFNKMPKRNVVSWTAMLGGYAMHGLAKEALSLFEQMCREGVEMNEVTFISLLSACSHAGLVDEGIQYFQSMGAVHNISANVEHYACMVVLLSRAGRLREAEDLVKTMSFEPNTALWMPLLSACRVRGDLEMAERIAKQVQKLDPENGAGYVLLSNLYAAAGNGPRSANVGHQRLWKGQLGQTWIEVNSEVHSFTGDDFDHPLMDEIYVELKRLLVLMKEAEYVPEVMLDNREEEGKVFFFPHHSEILTIAFGLISTPPGAPLHIYKNLEVCRRCHSTTKLISKIVKRSVIIREPSCCHHFKNGLCSCKDCW